MCPSPLDKQRRNEQPFLSLFQRPELLRNSERRSWSSPFRAPDDEGLRITLG